MMPHIQQRQREQIAVYARPTLLQRKCACGGTPGPDGECAACKAKRLSRQQSLSGRASAGVAPPIVHEVLGQPGQALNAATRGYMEPLFGHDFSQVSVHTDARAAESARSVNALAYTLGRRVVFDAGQYAPGTRAGQRLLAHELTHVVQQGSGTAGIQGKLSVNNPRHPSEYEADRAAEAVATGQKVGAISPGVASPGSTIQRVAGPCVDIVTPHTLLIRGSVHPAVREAQRKLNLFHSEQIKAATPGLPDAPLVDDCIFGEKTFNATFAFQQRVFPGLISEHDGKIGDHTWAMLDAVIVAPVPPAVVPPVVPPVAPPGCVAPANPDLSGSAFNPTTDSQNVVIAKNPIDAIRVSGARDDAFAAAGASGLAGPHLGPQDAFRHCVWNCFMAQRIGASQAEKFGTAHENSGPSSIPFDNQMDLHDNATGRGLGRPGADCAVECNSAVTSGRLRTIRGPHTRPPAVPPVPTTCIGASNQPWP